MRASGRTPLGREGRRGGEEPSRGAGRRPPRRRLMHDALRAVVRGSERAASGTQRGRRRGTGRRGSCGFLVGGASSRRSTCASLRLHQLSAWHGVMLSLPLSLALVAASPRHLELTGQSDYGGWASDEGLPSFVYTADQSQVRLTSTLSLATHYSYTSEKSLCGTASGRRHPPERPLWPA